MSTSSISYRNGSRGPLDPAWTEAAKQSVGWAMPPEIDRHVYRNRVGHAIETGQWVEKTIVYSISPLSFVADYYRDSSKTF